MQLMTVACNNCGAPLQVPDDAKFVTCNHCSSQLAIKHTDSVTFTEKLDEISERTERIVGELSELRSRQELDELDRQWALERETFMVTGKHGHRRIPSTTGSLFGGIIVVVFGIFWTTMAANIGGGPFALFGIVFIAFGIGTSIYSYVKAQDFLAAQRRYRRRRNQVSRYRPRPNE